MRKKLFLSLSYILVASLCACSRTEISSSDQTSTVEDSSISQEESSIVQDSSNTDTSSPIPDVDSSSSDEVIIDYDFEFPSLGGSAKVKEMSELASYTPTTFAASSYSVNSTELGDGVTLNKCSYTLTSSSSNILVNVVEVDLAKEKEEQEKKELKERIALLEEQLRKQREDEEYQEWLKERERRRKQKYSEMEM